LPVEDEDVLPVPVAKKAKLSLGALTSLKKSEKTSSSPAASPRSRLSKEIDRYISAFPVIDGDDDPLQWWKLNAKELPLLCQLSRRYLAIQASSSPSERLFSKAGQVSTPARAQLKPEKVDKLVFLAENL
ncbi:zinc finger BED domain-containing 1-like, partial [Paramuricea clavata]